ncbi:MAG TPA: phospholipase D-like domain-containing protein [Nocardioidaceae bacterium]|nr:phospholipase D-like domain-containing protein [Nocardioidaceae bacterium]
MSRGAGVRRRHGGVTGFVRRLLRRALLTVLGAQLTVIAALTGIDAWRKRVRPQSAQFPRTKPRSSVIGASTVTTFTYGEDLYEAMLAAIRGARELVLFETFMWKSDAVGQEFKDELVRAAERGVEVYVIYDAWANLVVPSAFKRFPDSLHVLEYPVFPAGWRFYDLRRAGRDHRKILVVDGEDGFVGGYNIGSMYATQWRDTHVRIEGSSAWDLQNAFVDFWNLRRTPELPALVDRGTSQWEARIRVHRNVPRSWVFPIRGMYLEAIDRAQHHIYLTQAYFIPDDDFLRSLLAAARRGVDVRILMPEVSNHVVADWLSRGFYATLLRNGVRLMLYRDAMVHAKTGTIDGQWTTIGTANIDRISLTGNYEVNVEFYDSDLAEQMQRVFETDCSNARELTLRAWERRHVAAKFSESVLAPLRPLL